MPLRRTLGLTAVTFYASGMILGAGIYSVLGAGAGMAGSALWVSFVLGAGVAALTGLSYAELVTMFPRAGAEYAYLREALPRWRWIPVMVGTLMVLSGAATATTVTLAFAGYLRVFVEMPTPVVALVLLVLFTGMNIIGLREAAWVNIAFTCAEVGGLLLVVAVAVLRADVLAPLAADLDHAVLPAAALVFFAYLGFENIASLAEETRDRDRTMPRALLISIAVTGVLYVLVAIAAVALLPPDQLAASDSPLAAALGAESPAAARVLGGIALFATANTGLISLVSVSRIAYGMACGGDAPPILARVLPGRETPWTSALLVFALAAALLPLGDVSSVASLSSFGALIAFVAVNAVVVVLRFSRPGARRPFRVRGAIGRVPVAAVVGAVASLLLVTQLAPATFAIGAIALAVGLGLHVARPLWA